MCFSSAGLVVVAGVGGIDDRSAVVGGLQFQVAGEVCESGLGVGSIWDATGVQGQQKRLLEARGLPDETPPVRSVGMLLSTYSGGQACSRGRRCSGG